MQVINSIHFVKVLLPIIVGQNGVIQVDIKKNFLRPHFVKLLSLFCDYDELEFVK